MTRRQLRSGGRTWPVRLAVLVLALTQALASVATVRGGDGQPPEFNAELAAELQAIIERVSIERPIFGIAATVTLADGSRWEGGTGFADRQNGDQPFTAHTPSVAGSISKTFMAALILKLAEEGKLTLDDSLSSWVPEKPFSERIKIKHLLRHTSGLPDYFRHRDYSRLVFKRPTHVWSKQEVMGLIKTNLRFSPGRSW